MKQRMDDDNVSENAGFIEVASISWVLPEGLHIVTHLTSQPSSGIAMALIPIPLISKPRPRAVTGSKTWDREGP